jgi:SAM-dependent methyltransferase
MKPTLKKSLRESWFFPRYIGTVYIESVLREVKSFARGTMVDVGCGTRQYESIFREAVNAYIGLDWPAVAERAFPDVIADALNIPFTDVSVDTVLATEVMEHLPSPQSFLWEVRRILRVGGTLILSVPFMEPIHEEPRDYYRFTPYSLRLLLEEHGYSIQKIWSRGGWWSVVLGSFVNQSLYDWSTSRDRFGGRHYSILTFLVLPICALAQWLAYQLDRLFHSQRYTLGYIVAAVRK